VFSPSFHGDWLWDDFEIRENAALRDWKGLANIWLGSGGPDYYPLKTSVLWVQWHLWHEHPIGYHLTNVALHLLSAFLIWHLLKKLGVRFAWIGGLLFAVHPMVVESVAWISELKNVLSLPLVLLAMNYYIDFDEGRDGRLARPGCAGVSSQSRTGEPPVPTFYLLSLLFFLAAMLAKSSVVMFPAAILLYCWWKRGRLTRADVLATVPFFVISYILGLVTVWFQQHRAIASWTLPRENFASRLAEAGLAIGFYFKKFLFPRDLMPIYPRWSFNPFSFVAFLPWLVLGTAVALLWMKRKTYGRHALFGLGWFVLNLVPVLGFVPMSYLHVAAVADHFAYLSLVGLVGLAAAAIGKLGLRPIVFLILVTALAWQSRRYAGIFVDQETMWAYNLRLNARSPAVYLNLAYIQSHDGRLAEAAANYENAIRLDPDDPQLEDGLAGVLIDENNLAGAVPHYEKAIAHYQRALELEPTLLGARRSLAKLLAKVGRTGEAIGQYEQVLQDDPDDAEIETDLGKALGDVGRRSEAISHYEKALQLDRRNAEAENSLGFALAGEGRPRDAIAHLDRALELKPDFAEAQNNLGFTLMGVGRREEAITRFEQALKLNPHFGQAHNNLGFALAGIGRREEAIVQFEAALKLKPDDAAAHYNLAIILEAAGKSDAALAQFKEALKLKPDFAAARAGLLRIEAAQIETDPLLH